MSHQEGQKKKWGRTGTERNSSATGLCRRC